MKPELQAPFPWFGGKSRVADLVWQRFGDVPNYVEPFFGSGAVLLGRPSVPGVETVNDLDGFVSNFWRAVKCEPDAVADAADWPVNENDLHARHAWLVHHKDDLQAKLEGNPDFFDVKIAGWWVWGLCSWIGSGWCSGNGPWSVVDGKLVDNRQLPHLSGARGINRKLPHLGDAGQGINSNAAVLEWMMTLACRLRGVRVCCGDWSRVCGPSPTSKLGLTGVFLDPPYSDDADRNMTLYRRDSGDVAHQAREWAIENGNNSLLRICLCGYEGEHVMPDGWISVAWKAAGGYGSQSDDDNSQSRQNAKRERLYFSPHCLNPELELRLA